MMAPLNKVTTGAQVLCYLNGQLQGTVRGVSLRMSSPTKRLYGLDSAQAFDLIPTTSMISGTIEIFRLVNSGGAEGMEIIPPPSMIQMGTFTSLILINKMTQEVIWRSDTVTISDQQLSVPVGGICTLNLSFDAIDFTSDGIATVSTP